MVARDESTSPPGLTPFAIDVRPVGLFDWSPAGAAVNSEGRQPWCFFWGASCGVQNGPKFGAAPPPPFRPPALVGLGRLRAGLVGGAAAAGPRGGGAGGR